ncbi:ZZ-type zinc finger-containing protein 3-like [Agrilus planipennis]|uniref:ZZ-type zinc finger-containing protein 3-like n=1 Tax=Agrilus planipennis TaxID=224129 RepID=A0A7F5R347_AGRPL|nr:ZZ-type zinc finger-containing protein 3-like [Agrilus planipennis]
MNSNDSDPNVSPKNSSPPEEGEEEEDLFYFESDHLAIKGNKDYSEILKTLFVLEAQRERAIKDYEKVVEIQKQALSDPLPFIEKIKNKEDVGIPPFQRIVEVPVIDWSKFDVQIPEAALKCLNSKDNSKGNLKSEDNIYKSRKSSDTHKKPWTTEEQKRLEELLEIYPPESVELRRFKKIAAALGNRTVKQVTSRVQKYFLKLYKAGLPIPGRIPKSAEKYKKSKLHLHQRNNHYLWKPSTFFPHLDIPVKMNDFEEVPGPSISHKAVLESSNSSNYLLPKPDEFGSSEYSIQHSNDTTEYKLKLLKRVKGIKEKELNLCVSFSHFGYKVIPNGDFSANSPGLIADLTQGGKPILGHDYQNRISSTILITPAVKDFSY